MNSSKQVIILRDDLNMRKGKMVAQGAHASLAALINTREIRRTVLQLLRNRAALQDWLFGSFAKICVRVNSEADLLLYFDLAQAANLPCSLIKDSGKTEFKSVPTYTAVAIGPAWSDQIDKITGDLKLL